jgi:thimet oligopeptidase
MISQLSLSFRLFHLIKQRFLCCGFCCSLREDVYLAVKAYAAKKETLSPQAQRFVDRLIRDYERLGLNLNADTRRKVEFLKTTIGELCIEFQQNMNEENRRLYFTEEELAGLPKNFIQVC